MTAQIIVGMFVLVVCWQMWQHYTTQQSCSYCGRFRGHKQDCPYDFEQR